MLASRIYKPRSFARFFKTTVIPVISGDLVSPHFKECPCLLSLVPRTGEQPLPAATIVGWFNRKPNGLVDDPENPLLTMSNNFDENPEMEKLVQKVLGQYVYLSPTWEAVATKTPNGWMHIVDTKAQNTNGLRLPDSEHIFGVVEVTDGKMVPNTYSPMPTHRLACSQGVSILDPFLEEKYLEEVQILMQE